MLISLWDSVRVMNGFSSIQYSPGTFWVLGDANVPAMYQVLVNDILRDFINRFIFVYLDAIRIFSKSVSENKSHIRQILLMPPGEQTLCQRRKVRTSCWNCLCPWLHCTAGQSLAEPNESESSGWLARTHWSLPAAPVPWVRHVIRHFSKIALPLIHLTSSNVLYL